MKASIGNGSAVLTISAVLALTMGMNPVGLDSATGASGSILSGVVRDSSGRPIAGAKVTVFLDGPSAAKIPSTVVGTEVKNPRIGTATTDADGRYAIDIPTGSPTLDDAARVNDGYVNLNLSARSAGLSGDRSVVRRLTTGGWWQTVMVAQTATAPVAVAEADDIVVTTDPSMAQPNCSPPEGQEVTSSAVLEKTWRATTKMVDLRSSVDMSATYGYGTTSDSTIEEAISYTPYDGYGFLGYSHLGQSTGYYASSKVSSRHHRQVRGHFIYGRYRYKEWIGCAYRYRYVVKAVRWDYDMWKGPYASNVGCPSGTYHYNYSRGVTFHKNSGVNHRYGADVTLPPVTLRGSHGYSNYSDIYFHFGISGGATYHHFRLCTKKPMSSAGDIYSTSWA